MRFGCCGSVSDAMMVAQAGFDFLEVSVQEVLRGDLSDGEWSRATVDTTRLALPIEAANCLVPGAMDVVGDGRDVGALDDYMKRVAHRARSVGIRRLVFGSGGARQRPDGMDEATARTQLLEFLQVAGKHCEDAGVVLVIEHLNRQETNTINTLGEARALMAQAGSSAVAGLVDSYHFGVEGEAWEAISAWGEHLKHVHVAEPQGRWEPGGAESGEGFSFLRFFRELKLIGYEQRISVEARQWHQPRPQVMARTCERLRQWWADV